MRAFFAFNPKFGEMIFLNSFSGEGIEGSFNLSYPNFKNISKSSSIEKFMTSHLSVTDCANNVDDALDDIRNQVVGEQEIDAYENRSVQSSTSSDDSDDDIAIIMSDSVNVSRNWNEKISSYDISFAIADIIDISLLKHKTLGFNEVSIYIPLT